MPAIMQARRTLARASAMLAAIAALIGTSDSVRAEQFVLFDVTFTFTKEDADNSKPSKSHYYVKGDMLNPNRPRDWTAPVDYRNGTVHIRAEVIEKPAGGEPTTWTLCYIPNKGQGNGYGCTGTGVYREKGVYEQDVSMKSFWENDSIVWSEGHQADGPGHQGRQRRRRPRPQAGRPREVLPDQDADHHGPGVGRFEVRPEPRPEPAEPIREMTLLAKEAAIIRRSPAFEEPRFSCIFSDSPGLGLLDSPHRTPKNRVANLLPR